MWPLPTLFGARLAVLGGFTAAGLAAGLWIGYALTSDYYELKLTRAQNERDAAVIQAQQDILAKERLQQQKTNEVANEYETQLRVLRDKYDAAAERLREQARGRAAMRSAANATGKCYAAANSDGLSERVIERLVLLARQADEQTQRLIACQSWIKMQMH